MRFLTTSQRGVFPAFEAFHGALGMPSGERGGKEGKGGGVGSRARAKRTGLSTWSPTWTVVSMNDAASRMPFKTEVSLL